MARLERYSEYQQDSMIELSYWDHSITNIGIEYAKTDYTDRKTSKVRLIFEVDTNSQRYFKVLAVKYGAIELLTDIGSWAGLMLAAYIILWWYQWLAAPFGNINSHDARHASDIVLKRSDELYGQKKLNKLMRDHPELFAELEAEAGLAPGAETQAWATSQMNQEEREQMEQDEGVNAAMYADGKEEVRASQQTHSHHHASQKSADAEPAQKPSQKSSTTTVQKSTAKSIGGKGGDKPPPMEVGTDSEHEGIELGTDSSTKVPPKPGNKE
jgi:hypothetical protein